MTADRNIKRQQTMKDRPIAVIELPTNRWRVLRENAPRIAEAVGRVRAGDCVEVRF
ncbi:MAG: hypothetical protein JOY83_12040 [Alphaproteobacteria bacterium]|nr:hypothetical protein [Alphaproteobacteria bacterium]